VHLDVEAGATHEESMASAQAPPWFPCSAPPPSRIVHPVDHDADLVHAGCHDVPACLPALLELVLARRLGGDERRHVRLRRTRDLRRSIVRLVPDTSRIVYRVSLNVRPADLDHLVLGQFLRCRVTVEHPGQLPGLATCFLRLAIVLLHRTFVDHPTGVSAIVLFSASTWPMMTIFCQPAQVLKSYHKGA
jgi:hypothetical protein